MSSFPLWRGLHVPYTLFFLHPQELDPDELDRDRDPHLTPLWLGGHTKKLNAPLPFPNSDVVDFLLDPSGTRAVFVADQDVPGVRELYSVPLDMSSPPIRLNDPMSVFGDVATAFDSHNLEMSATGRVLYRADALADETFELFSVPADGSAPPVRLNDALVPGGDVVDWALSPGGTQVVHTRAARGLRSIP